MRGTWAYTQHDYIFIPDVEITKPKPEYVYVPLRGYAFVMAVIVPGENNPIKGFINSEYLGYPSVDDWIFRTKWQDEGH